MPMAASQDVAQEFMAEGISLWEGLRLAFAG